MLKFLPGYLLDLVFPVFCQGCASEGSYLCLPCQNRIEPPIHRCMVCNKNSPLGQVHPECADSKTALTGLLVAAEYSQPGVRNLIWQMKYNSVKDISQTLGVLMADLIVKNDMVDYFAHSLVVPVPMYKNRVRFRGFNQAEEIAKHFSANLGLAYCDLLIKSRSTTRQVELEKKLRLENLKGAFALRDTPGNKLSGQKIILIDDVATTGSTLNECALVLKKSGPAEIWGLVVARN